MVMPILDYTNIEIIFGSAIAGVAVFWSIKKAIQLIN